MDLTHEFTVPSPIEETWARFQDIATLAECFPGGQVTSVEGDTFKGTVKVKLGPIAMVYAGSGTFVEKDDTAHRLVVDAKGRDKRGNGTAGAKATLTMTESGGSTTVHIVTDLSITGKPAQFGRGVIQDVSDKLLGQFVACLEKQSEGSDSPSVEPASAASGVETNTVRSEATGVGLDTGSASAPPGSTSGAAGSPSGATVGSTSGGAGSTSGAVGSPSGATVGAATGATGRHVGQPSAPAQNDTLDLGATVLPVIARTYWKQGVAALGGLGLVVVLVKLLRRGKGD